MDELVKARQTAAQAIKAAEAAHRAEDNARQRLDAAGLDRARNEGTTGLSLSLGCRRD